MPLELSAFRRRLLGWYDRSQRALPWRALRGQRPDPYLVLVSEMMLQQTQVATVIPYFRRFLECFPTPGSLADAPQQEVLRLWQGLGYYARARNLQRAAQTIVRDLGGVFPQTVDALMALPGVGRYTAGAISSLAFDRPAPILDGNVMRVLCRLDAIAVDPRDSAIQRQLWRRAENLLPRRRAGDFNSALMELGATVCAPRRPQCPSCPVRLHCKALTEGIQESIPPPRPRRPTPVERRIVLCIHRRGRYLIEQRPARGRWAGMWQFIARPPATAADGLPVSVRSQHPLGQIRHALTHRRYVFDVVRCAAGSAGGRSLTWVTLAELAQYPLPRPHQRIVQLLRCGKSM